MEGAAGCEHRPTKAIRRLDPDAPGDGSPVDDNAQRDPILAITLRIPRDGREPNGEVQTEEGQREGEGGDGGDNGSPHLMLGLSEEQLLALIEGSAYFDAMLASGFREASLSVVDVHVPGLRAEEWPAFLQLVCDSRPAATDHARLHAALSLWEPLLYVAAEPAMRRAASAAEEACSEFLRSGAQPARDAVAHTVATRIAHAYDPRSASVLPDVVTRLSAAFWTGHEVSDGYADAVDDEAERGRAAELTLRLDQLLALRATLPPLVRAGAYPDGGAPSSGRKDGTGDGLPPASHPDREIAAVAALLLAWRDWARPLRPFELAAGRDASFSTVLPAERAAAKSEPGSEHGSEQDSGPGPESEDGERRGAFAGLPCTSERDPSVCGLPVLVPTLRDFRERLAGFFPVFGPHVDAVLASAEGNAVLAGGAVLGALQSDPFAVVLDDSDLDLWIFGESEESRRSAFARAIGAAFAAVPGCVARVSWPVVTFGLPAADPAAEEAGGENGAGGAGDARAAGEGMDEGERGRAKGKEKEREKEADETPARHGDAAAPRRLREGKANTLQIVFTRCRTAHEVVMRFDLGYVELAYDGRRVTASPEALWSLSTRATRFRAISGQPLRPSRARKAERKGFAVQTDVPRAAPERAKTAEPGPGSAADAGAQPGADASPERDTDEEAEADLEDMLGFDFDSAEFFYEEGNEEEEEEEKEERDRTDGPAREPGEGPRRAHAREASHRGIGTAATSEMQDGGGRARVRCGDADDVASSLQEVVQMLHRASRRGRGLSRHSPEGKGERGGASGLPPARDGGHRAVPRRAAGPAKLRLELEEPVVVSVRMPLRTINDSVAMRPRSRRWNTAYAEGSHSHRHEADSLRMELADGGPALAQLVDLDHRLRALITLGNTQELRGPIVASADGRSVTAVIQICPRSRVLDGVTGLALSACQIRSRHWVGYDACIRSIWDAGFLFVMATTRATEVRVYPPGFGRAMERFLALVSSVDR